MSKGMNLSVVRLCFQAYLPDEKGFFRHALEPVFGQKVYDSSEFMCTHAHTRTRVHLHMSQYSRDASVYLWLDVNGVPDAHMYAACAS